MLELTSEMMITLVSSALVGAAAAWQGTRIVNAELLGHIRNHCDEIDELKRRINSNYESIGRLQTRVAVLSERIRRVPRLYPALDDEDES